MSYYSFLPKLINMSLTASVAIVLVILLRLLLKKAPKVISYALWGVVLFRLLCPVSIGSDFSLYNLFDAPAESTGTVTSVIEYVPSDIVYTEYPVVTLPVPGVSDAINETLPQGEEQLRADPLEGPLFLATCLWMLGVSVMLICSAVSYIRLRRKLLVVVPLRNNIFIADDIKSPFVVGLLRPRIYLPCNLSAKEQEYIILHEQHHIKRLDHIAKALAFLALTIHWFNPLVWVAFTLAGKDMEMSCDEAVIRKARTDVRADYSASLLTLATGQRIIAGTPLAFGEGDTKGRIHNLSKWKKPTVWVVAIASVACIVLAVSLLTNPKKLTIYDIFDQNGYSVISQNEVDITLYIEKSKLPDTIYTAEGHEFKPNEVLAYSTETSRVYLHKAMLSNESDDLLYLIFDCSYDLPESGSFVSPYQYVDESDSTQSTLGLRSKDLRDGSTTYPDALSIRGHGPGAQFAFYVSKEACMAAKETLIIDVVCTQIDYARAGHGYDSQQASSSDIRNPWVQEYVPGAEGIIGNVDKESYESISEDFAIGADQYGRAVFKDPHKAFDTFLVLYADGIALIQEQNDLKPISPKSYSAYKKFGWQVTSGLVETQEQAAFVTKFLDLYENSFTEEIPSPSTEIPTTAPATPVVKWFDYLNTPEEIPSEGPLEITLPEFPDVTFRWYPKKMEAVKNGKVHALYSGSPIWNTYFCDLTGDGLPELCSTIRIGSDNIILVYDYANSKGYDTTARGVCDFSLRLSKDGQLYADQRVHSSGELVTSGLLVFKDNYLEISNGGASLITTDLTADSFEAAIRSAIIEYNKPSAPTELYPDGLYHCASFVQLQQVELSFDSDPPRPNQVTVYGLALYQGYTLADNRIYAETGSHIPVAITFEVENGKYILKEYWQPGDGSYYVPDIRDKFPDEIEEDAIDTQKYIRAQIQNCYAQAIEFGGIDTTAAIEHLFEFIESCPLQSSNPGDYIDEHYIEYRELTYYGQYTLRYCFEQFLKGGQTGLRGHLMRALLDDLAPEAQLKLQAMTGQEYFDAWKAAAIRISEQHSTDWIKGNQPAVYLLLQMMDA